MNGFWIDFIHTSFQQLLDWWDNDPSNGLSESLQYNPFNQDSISSLL